MFQHYTLNPPKTELAPTTPIMTPPGDADVGIGIIKDASRL